MEQTLTRPLKDALFKLSWAIPLLLPAILCLFWNLDHVAFWDDEVQTVWLAKNLIRTGKLTGWDGQELYAYRNGSLLTSELKIIQPPLDIITTAISLKLLGENETAARLPFALFGLMSLVLFFFCVNAIFRSQRISFLSTLCLTYSTAFILNARQCRYYALTLFWGLLTLRLYQLLQTRPSLWQGLVLSFSLVMLYLSNYLIAAGWVLTLLCAQWYFHRETFRKSCFAMAPYAGFSLVVMVVHALLFRIWDRHDIDYDSPWLFRTLHHLWHYPRDLVYFCPTTLIIATLIWNRLRFRNPNLTYVLFLFFGNAIFIALFTPQPGNATHSDIRFSIMSLPWGAVVVGVLASWVLEIHRYLAVTFLFLVLTTNIFIQGYTRAKPQFTFSALIISLSRHYLTGTEEAAAYIRGHLKEGETVLATPDHFTYPLSLYSGATTCCVLDDLSRIPRRGLPLRLFSCSPNWVVLFEKAPHTKAVFEKLEGQYVWVHTTESYFDQTQRPEPFEHSFLPRKAMNLQERVFIYRRVLAPLGLEQK